MVDGRIEQPTGGDTPQSVSWEETSLSVHGIDAFGEIYGTR